ncbi:hypothetical protein [Geodermatophilus sp. URMC 62]|uniref:hypothetical protein n=1 Tax=Geodermatophilus sp. URMC 62 TaxID=3423414 RepID=UPI00406BF47F
MWTWIAGGLAAWVVVAVALGVVLGRGIRLADERSPGTGAGRRLTTASLSDPRPAGPAGRGRLPLPPFGIVLALVAVALETVGFLLRLTGARGQVAQTLSMDAPLSLPRTYVAALFAAAALAAVAGAGRNPGRRTWWLAVAAVTAGIAVVKAGGTVHVTAVHWLADRTSSTAATVVSALLAVAVLAVLAVVSRAERRDRRRVLTALCLYAAASVGLSAVSAAVDARWTTVATFVEETGEALGGVAVLVAVLVGVAPRLVLPTSWLRRRDDDLSLEVPPLRTLAPRD